MKLALTLRLKVRPPSHTHFTAAGTLEIGRRYAEALLSFESAK
jgi:hypothetical protein